MCTSFLGFFLWPQVVFLHTGIDRYPGEDFRALCISSLLSEGRSSCLGLFKLQSLSSQLSETGVLCLRITSCTRNFFQAENWGNYRAHLIYFPFSQRSQSYITCCSVSENFIHFFLVFYLLRHKVSVTSS